MRKTALAVCLAGITSLGLASSAGAAGKLDTVAKCRDKGGVPVYAFAGSVGLLNACLFPQTDEPSSATAPSDPITRCREEDGGFPVYLQADSLVLLNSCFFRKNP